MRTAKGYRAAVPGIKKVISASNLDITGGGRAFFVNLDTTTCYLFDHMQLKSNLSQLKSAVGAIVEPMLGIEDRLSYEVVTGCLQNDNSSCGVWCLVVLELQLFGATLQSWSDFWNDSLYDVLDYLRMRYLYKVEALERQISIMAEGDEKATGIFYLIYIFILSVIKPKIYQTPQGKELALLGAHF
ncbi:hypothetical protein AM588_10002870 [Phytophthora nicotianae]|nr:hypothetical protein AM588_10002870 [Phytophthora nicotianae]